MNSSEDIWSIVVTSYMDYVQAVSRFMSGDYDRVTIIKKALRSSDQLTAIHLLKFLPQEELQQLFEDLIFFASSSHGAVEYIREIIKKMPREWVIHHIEQAAEPLLENGTDEEYRRLLELYIELDEELTKKLAQRAIKSTDYDIQEAGEDFLSKIGS